MVQKPSTSSRAKGSAAAGSAMWYEMPRELTTADTIAVTSPQSCGEVEPILIGVEWAAVSRDRQRPYRALM